MRTESGSYTWKSRSTGSWIAEQFAAGASRLRTALKEYHRKNPLQAGMPKEEFRSREFSGAPAFYLDAALESASDVVAEGQIVRLASHKAAFGRRRGGCDPQDRIHVSAGRVWRRRRRSVVLEKSGVDGRRARSLLQVLLRDGRLIKASEELIYHETAIRALRALLQNTKASASRCPQFKEWTRGFPEVRDPAVGIPGPPAPHASRRRRTRRPLSRCQNSRVERSNSRALEATFSTFSSVTAVLPFSKPRPVTCM